MKPPKKIQLLMSFILSFGVWVPSVLAEEILGVMRCKVVDQGVRLIREGRLQSYSRPSEEYPKVGERVILTYGVTAEGRFKFQAKFEGEFVFETIWRDTANENPESWREIDFSVQRDGEDWYRMIDSDSDFNEILWNSDRVEVDGLFGRLILSRYYKSDWQGLYTESRIRGYDGTGLRMSFSFIDCRHIRDGVDEITLFLSGKAK